MVNELWEALKQGCTVRPEKAKLIVFLSEDKFKAIAGPVLGGYHLTEQQGKAVQEVLNRYVNEELKPRLDFPDEDMWSDPEGVEDARRETDKDIDYITGLAKLFD